MSAISWSSVANGTVILSITALIVAGRPDADSADLSLASAGTMPTTVAQIVQGDGVSAGEPAPATKEDLATRDWSQGVQVSAPLSAESRPENAQPDDAVLRAERWRNRKGREFAAASCLIMGGPSFANGCVQPDFVEDFREVRVVQLSPAEGAPASVAEGLGGHWQSGGLSLHIDTKRAQAKYGAERPLEWKRFLIRAVEDEGVIFAIGSEVYQARIEPDRLVLTSTLFRGEQVLYRR